VYSADTAHWNDVIVVLFRLDLEETTFYNNLTFSHLHNINNNKQNVSHLQELAADLNTTTPLPFPVRGTVFIRNQTENKQAL
jgi:hypothetical protein